MPPSLRAIQAPIKERYKTDPKAAYITLKPKARSTTPTSPARSRPARALAVAGLHPATGGWVRAVLGRHAARALVACAGVTIKAVATALAIPLKSGTVSAEGDLDFAARRRRQGRTGRLGGRSALVRGGHRRRAGEARPAAQLTTRYCVVYQTISPARRSRCASTACEPCGRALHVACRVGTAPAHPSSRGKSPRRGCPRGCGSPRDLPTYGAAMSPDLLFVLSLRRQMAVRRPSWSATYLAERAGQVVGGMIATLADRGGSGLHLPCARPRPEFIATARCQPSSSMRANCVSPSSTRCGAAARPRAERRAGASCRVAFASLSARCRGPRRPLSRSIAAVLGFCPPSAPAAPRAHAARHPARVRRAAARRHGRAAGRDLIGLSTRVGPTHRDVRGFSDRAVEPHADPHPRIGGPRPAPGDVEHHARLVGFLVHCLTVRLRRCRSASRGAVDRDRRPVGLQSGGSGGCGGQSRWRARRSRHGLSPGGIGDRRETAKVSTIFPRGGRHRGSTSS